MGISPSVMDTPDGGSATEYFRRHPGNSRCLHHGRVQGVVVIKCLECNEWTLDGVTWHALKSPEPTAEAVELSGDASYALMIARARIRHLERRLSALLAWRVQSGLATYEQRAELAALEEAADGG